MSSQDITTAIAVRGTATMEVAPDRAELRLGASHLAPTREEATAAVNEVVVALRRQVGALDGVEDVTISRVRCSAEYDHSDSQSRLVGFRASAWGSAGCLPAAVPRAAAVVGECRGDLQGVSWLLEDDNPAYRVVRRRAVEAARVAAEDFADAIGRSLGPLEELADAGLLEPSPRGGMERTYMAVGDLDEAEVELDPEPVEIGATVEARFTA